MSTIDEQDPPFLRSGGLLNEQQQAAFVKALKEPCVFCGAGLSSCKCFAEGEAS